MRTLQMMLIGSAAVVLATTGVKAQIGTVQIADGLANPLYVTAPPGDADRLFIVERGGAIKILNRNTGAVNPTPFLSMDSSTIVSGGEQGLLGLAFHPDYAANGRFYVNYTRAGDGATVIREYQRLTADQADPTGFSQVISYAQPAANHNGGWLGFGPDGYLYVSSGDGGGSNDPSNNAQNTASLLGKILRLDVNGDDFGGDATRNYAIPSNNPFATSGGAPEVWAYGLRNPWRASFDRQGGDFWIGDVGQGAREELNFQPADSAGGENYGWRLREGMIATPSGGVGGDRPAGAIDPIYDYVRNPGNAITGGYVYRGPITELQGQYFFGDFGSAQIWSLMFDGTDPADFDGTNFTDFTNWTSTFAPDIGSIDLIASFGEDADGNLYIVDLGGEVYMIVPEPGAAGLLIGAVLLLLGRKRKLA